MEKGSHLSANTKHCFTGKKVALFCPNFFSYDAKISQELSALGADVRLFDDRPSNSVLVKSLIRFKFKTLMRKVINDYYNNIISELEVWQPDFILFVNPETPDKKIIRKFKRNFPQSSLLAYMWDSVANKKGILNYIHLMDKCFTFDPFDAKKYNLTFLPLFYSNEYKEIHSENSQFKYDLCFIGTIHTQRMKFVDEIRNLTGVDKCFFYFYCPSRIVFFYKKYITRELKDVPVEKVSFRPLSSADVADIVKVSRCIIDMPHSAQKGLTMRTFEMLGAGRKMITTSDNIDSYDFFKESNIFIFDKRCHSEIKTFIRSDYLFPDDDIYEKYSLRSWLCNIMVDV